MERYPKLDRDMCPTGDVNQQGVDLVRRGRDKTLPAYFVKLVIPELSLFNQDYPCKTRVLSVYLLVFDSGESPLFLH